MAGLDALLTVARDRGFLGPGDVAFHVEHAMRYATVLDRVGAVHPASKILDLGSGGGVPGLVLAVHLGEPHFTLLDAGHRRCEFLAEAARELGLDGRVQVVRDRAELAGRRADLRGAFDAVVARSFAGPAATAECAAPFLSLQGVLVVSEPRTPASRWSAEGLSALGMVEQAGFEDQVARLKVIRQAEPCPDRFPRADGVPRKRPLFTVPDVPRGTSPASDDA